MAPPGASRVPGNDVQTAFAAAAAPDEWATGYPLTGVGRREAAGTRHAMCRSSFRILSLAGDRRGHGGAA